MSETREKGVIRPDISAGHRAVLLRRPNSTRARFFPTQIKTFVEVPAILRIRVFAEQRRVPFEVLTLVDIELGKSSRRRFKSGNRRAFLEYCTFIFVESGRAKKLWAAKSAPDIAEAGIPCPLTAASSAQRRTLQKEVAHWIRTIKETDVDRSITDLVSDISPYNGIGRGCTLKISTITRLK